jgi:drug/metabolite transporter (DMT)-like permease
MTSLIPTGADPRARFGGWLDGVTGMLIFSASLPATRVAVLSFDPLFLTFARAAIAGALAGLVVLVRRDRAPARRDLAGLLVVAGGVVVGFPLLTALALRQVTSSHATVFLGLLPLSTALFAVVRAGERPRPVFWLFALLGAALVAGYALSRAAAGSLAGDGLMVAAILVCGLGYAEGGRLSRHLGGLRVIVWALVISLPLTAPLALALRPATWSGVGWPALAGLAYVSLFSMLIGFVFWYRGLARGGIAAIGQLQLIQPFFALLLAAALLHEKVGMDMVAVLAGVVICVAGAPRFSTGAPRVPAASIDRKTSPKEALP